MGTDDATRPFAVVTGGSGGIGAAICRRLSGEGYAILVQYRSREEAAVALRDEIREGGGLCEIVGADLEAPAGVDEVVAAARAFLDAHPDRFLRTLVNNAALLMGPGFRQATPEQFDTYFAVNTRAPFFLAQGLVPLMGAGASIVNISSAAVHMSSPGDIVYAMTKAAIESFTRNLAEAIAPVRVNAVIPGFTDNGHPGFQVPEVRAYMSGHALLGDVAQPETIAAAVAFLASDGACRTTGSTLDVTGGSTLGARTGEKKGSVRGLLG